MAIELVEIKSEQVDEQRLGHIAISLTNWNNTSEPLIASGSTVEIGGSLYQIDSNTDIDPGGAWAGIGNSNRVYGYINSSTLLSVLTTTEPTWSLEKQAWYDATETHRYYLKMYKDGSGNYTQKEILKNRVSYSFQPVVPVGSIIAWHKSMTGVPQDLSDNFLECDGSVISDSDSPLNGQTLPDLNGDERFLRGGSTSGDEQADAMQRITGEVDDIWVTGIPSSSGSLSTSSGTATNRGSLASSGTRKILFDNANSTSPNAAKTDDEETRPINMSVVWIMRIK